MPRKPMPWFRYYVEALDDGKITRHPPAVRHLWTTILGLARQSPVPGRLMITEASPHTVETLAGKSGCSSSQVRKALPEFVKDKMLTNEEGVWVVLNFGRRQFESDSSTERVRQHRSNTHDGTTLERSNDRYGNVPSLCKTSDFQTFRDPEPPPPSQPLPDATMSPAEAAFCNQVIAEVAQRQLRMSRQPVANPPAWLRKARNSIQDEHLMAIRAAYGNLTVGQAVDLLEPPPKPSGPGAFHALDCVCAGQGTDRSCSGVMVEA